MATKDSEELKSDERYPLGDYSFRIERTSVPGSTNDKIEAICTDKDGKNARKSIQVPSSTQIDGWFVEANETEATVYVKLRSQPLDISPFSVPVPCGSNGSFVVVNVGSSLTYEMSAAFLTSIKRDSNIISTIFADSDPSGTYISYHNAEGPIPAPSALQQRYTYNNLTVYYTSSQILSGIRIDSLTPLAGGETSWHDKVAQIAWTMVYGNLGNESEKMVGRFAIELEDAGGVGPGSDWTDPGDYDPDWEEGDPTHTLYVTATGALSGRHNDPIEDPSYSYIPADKDTVKDYGCGGDGGHGGGGGAGASTVVVHKFATNQANSKEVTAIARRHGYGSGGGKGGKGGDGCILVYY